MGDSQNSYDFEHAPCGYLSFHPDGTIMGMNATLLTWLNLTREEAVGVKKLEQITSKGTALYLQMFVYPLLKMQGYVNKISLNIGLPEARPLSCLLNASAIRDDQGDISQVHGILFQISERKKYETEILQEKKAAEDIARHQEKILQLQRRILSILGHDTRAPLVAVNRMIKLAAEGKISPEAMFPYFEPIANQLDAILILVGDLLSWSQAIFSGGREAGAWFSLWEVNSEVFELLENNARTKGLQLQNEIEPELFLLSNRSMISFIVRNLVSNSIKFTRTGGVKVSASATGDEVRIMVEDTGVGMSADQLQQYLSGKASSVAGTENEPGTGMGMALVQDFLMQLGGKLSADSELGKGTCVSLSIPAAVQRSTDPILPDPE